jgi:hypothetical protein
VAEQMHDNSVNAAKEREQLLGEMIALKANAVSLEQQNLSLKQSNDTVIEKLRCSDERMTEYRGEIATMQAESRASNEMFVS